MFLYLRVLSSWYFNIILNDFYANVLLLLCLTCFITVQFTVTVGSKSDLRTSYYSTDNLLNRLRWVQYSSYLNKQFNTDKIKSKANCTPSYSSSLISAKKAYSKTIINALLIAFILFFMASLKSYRYILGVCCRSTSYE